MPNAPFLAPERDSALKWGRVKASGGTIPGYEVPGTLIASNAALTAITVNTDYYGPFFTQSVILVDKLAFHVTTGVAGNARCGIYAADTDLQPIGAPLADSGDIDVTGAAVKTYTPATPILLPRGRYVTVFNTSASIDVRPARCGPVSYYDTAGFTNYVSTLTVTRTYAAFPTPGTKWDTATVAATIGLVSIVVMRVSSP